MNTNCCTNCSIRPAGSGGGLPQSMCRSRTCPCHQSAGKKCECSKDANIGYCRDHFVPATDTAEKKCSCDGNDLDQFGKCPHATTDTTLWPNGGAGGGGAATDTGDWREWIPVAQQGRNKRSVGLHLYKGQTYTTGELARMTGFKRHTIYARMKHYKWSVAKTVETPIFYERHN